jgi:glyoxylase-like metal-dependent hydrolase (beta-lactamase superfamily II)
MTGDRRHFLKAGLGGLAGLTAVPLLGSLAGCQQNPARAPDDGTQSEPAPAMSTQKLTERVSVISGAPGNVVVLSDGSGSVVLVDSGSVKLAPAVKKSLADARVHALFNTHYHADQTGGNALFARSGAEIHAHTITKQWLAADYYVPADDRWVKAPPREAVPKVTFRTRGEMAFGAETIEFGYLLEAHTRGDAYVYFRDANVLAVGDVFSPQRDPALDWYAGGWLGGRVDAMDDLLELVNDQTRIVPAYGPVMSRAEVQAERDMMAKLYELTAAATHKGRSAQDMLNDGILNQVGREFQDPYRFLYDVAKGLQAHYTNFGGNVV